MSSISKFSIKKPITIIMGVLVVILLGIISITNLTTDLFPSMNLPYAIVSTTYVGASPEEVELIVTKPIEQSMATVSGIKNILSVSKENVSMVILEFNDTVNMDSVVVDMRESLDRTLSYMPEAVGNPMIMKLNPDMMPVMVMSASFSDLDVSASSQLLESEIMPRLERVSGVASLMSIGMSDNIISVKLSDEKIDALKGIYGNSISIDTDMIKGIISGQNFNMPAGYVSYDGDNYLVRVGDKVSGIDAVGNLSIIKSDYMDIKISDVADVAILDSASDVYSKVNLEDAITFIVQKQNNFATTDVVDSLTAEIKLLETDYETLEITELMNQGEYIDLAVGSVLNNLMYGAILAIFVLILFLKDIKPTIIIGLAIPISVLFAFVMIYFFGITMNIISMGGLALGIGMLVDNAIVVIENIYRLRGEGMGLIEAAREGSREVAGAITASTLTTIVVFLPVLFLEGITAQLLTELALTITFALVASLLIALSVVPMMASKMLNAEKEKEHKMFEKLKNGYNKILNVALKYRKSTLAFALVLFIGSTILVFNGGMEFIPESESGQLSAVINVDKNLSFDEKSIILDTVNEKIYNIDGVSVVSSDLGSDAAYMTMFTGDGLSVSILLDENAKRKTKDIVKDIEAIADETGYPLVVSDAGTDMSMLTGEQVSVEIKGEDLTILREITLDIEKTISEIEGIIDIDNGLGGEAPEIKITVDKDKSIAYGLTNAQVYAGVISEINADTDAGSITSNNITYDINVYEADSNTTEWGIDEIENINISSPYGSDVKISSIATVDYGVGYNTINRANQSRLVNITAGVDKGYNVKLVNDEIKEKLDSYELPTGYTITYGGESAEIASSMSSLLYAIGIGVLLVYMIMAAQFENLLSPFIVMFTVPLAFTGSFLLLLITGIPLSIVGMIGLVVLTGVVVNNGIVLVDYIHRLRKNGMEMKEAVKTAGNVRLRPIVMTALTTILALITMAIGVGEGAEMMQPMAITTIGGLIYATMLTVIIIPVLYSYFDRYSLDG